MALEEKRSEVKEHFQVLGAMGSEDIHTYVGGAPVDAIGEIKNAVEEIKPALVIIDPLFRFTRVRDGNDYHQVTNALEPLLRLARDTGTHVLCVHHSKKGEGAAEDSFLGSQAIFGSVDTLMIMKRHEHYRTLQTIQRYGDDLPETTLCFDKDSRSISLGGGKQEEDANITGNAIIDFLSTQSEPVTEQIIMNEVEGGNSLKKKTLRELVKTNKLKRDGQGTRGKPFLYSGILVQSIYVVPVYQNQKMTANPYGSRAYSGTEDFTNLQKDGKSFVPESLPQEQQKRAADNTLKDDVKIQNPTQDTTLNKTDIVDLSNMADLEILEIQ